MDGAGEEHYKRDARGRLVELARKVDGKEYRVRYEHDDLDRMTQVTFPDDRTIDLHYNARGLLESVPGVIRSIEYSERGLALRREHENGAVSTASYDAMDRVASLETVTGGRQSGSLAAGRSYDYDDLYRLVSAVGGDRSWSYGFNGVGDFVQKTGTGDYTLGKAHQIAAVGGRPPT